MGRGACCTAALQRRVRTAYLHEGVAPDLVQVAALLSTNKAKERELRDQLAELEERIAHANIDVRPPKHPLHAIPRAQGSSAGIVAAFCRNAFCSVQIARS
jgi:hypothetical protein